MTRPAQRQALALLAFAALVFATPEASAQRLWRRLMPVDRVDADPAADYSLQQGNGPWLIMAATFGGDGAERQAEQLALELRSEHNLKTYIHDVTIDRTAGTTGLGVDKYGAPLKMRYRTGNKAHEWAVLVGDFTTVDENAAQDTLAKIKTLKPNALVQQNGQTAQSLAGLRVAQAKAANRLAGRSDFGPMSSAFITRNPLLPKEYFTPKGVDNFVAKMNRGFDHNLLDAKGKYTVKVATFRCVGGIKSIVEKSKRRGKNSHDVQVRAAENAHILVERMREKGIEAYEFHDRKESIVTVGAFDVVASRGPQGEQPTPEVQRILQTFGAAYDTPTDPLLNAGLNRRVGHEAQQRMESFSQRFNGQHGQVAGGYQPKFVRAEPKNPSSRIITFDIHPHVIEVPKRSISSSFAWRR